MQGRWWGRAIGGMVLTLGVVTGWTLGGKVSPEAQRAHCLSLRLLPMDEWGFGREAHAPVPIPLPIGITMNPSSGRPHSAQRRFRISIPNANKESGAVSEPDEVPVYVRIGIMPKAGSGPAGQPSASLNTMFLQSQMQRQTQMLQLFQGRLHELQSLLRKAATSLREPQKRVIQMDREMLQAQITALQQAQTMTLQALTHTAQASRYMRLTLSPTLIVSETLLARLATEGETVRLGPVEFARTARVQIETLH